MMLPASIALQPFGGALKPLKKSGIISQILAEAGIEPAY
jgi:hypothetical protein